MVFCFENCFDILCEKNVLVIEMIFWKLSNQQFNSCFFSLLLVGLYRHNTYEQLKNVNPNNIVHGVKVPWKNLTAIQRRCLILASKVSALHCANSFQKSLAVGFFIKNNPKFRLLLYMHHYNPLLIMNHGF